MMKLKALLPLAMLPMLIGIAMLVLQPDANHNATAADTDQVAVPVNQDGTPVVVTVEVPVTVEVTRVITVVVTPTFTPLPPTPTNLPPELTVDDDPYLGSADAVVKVVEFSDFQCGFCARFAVQTLPTLINHYGDHIQFVYRDYPIFGDPSIYAALATECAADQDMFWEYHNRVFENQVSEQKQELNLVNLEQWATDLGLDVATWNTCMESTEAFDEIVFDYNTGYEWGITGTPTFFINGQRIVGAQPIEVFYSIIDAELIAAGIEPPARD